MNQGGILSGKAIEEAVKNGRIAITPFNPEQVNTASYDVTLGHEVKVYERVTWMDGDIERVPHIYPGDAGVLDAARDNPTRSLKLSDGAPLRLVPGVGYLMHTVERVQSEDFVAVLDGKSSLGRLFVSVHETAGYIDPGFEGQITLEVTVTHPVRLYQGMRIGQIRFHSLIGEVVSYKKLGHYVNENASGAIASQSYRMFSK